jgi:hypothetical protein
MSGSRGWTFFNEAELQHELGAWLRGALVGDALVYFERPVTSFYPAARGLAKKEIDLVVADPTSGAHVALELKCPRNGRIPETMYDACKDIQLLEQLVDLGFAGGIFLLHTIDPGFYSVGVQDGIYSHFRAGVPLAGTISKPTGKKDTFVALRESYEVRWQPTEGSGRYWLQSVRGLALEIHVALFIPTSIRRNAPCRSSTPWFRVVTS